MRWSYEILQKQTSPPPRNHKTLKTSQFPPHTHTASLAAKFALFPAFLTSRGHLLAFWSHKSDKGATPRPCVHSQAACGSMATKAGNNWEELSVNSNVCYCSEGESVLAPAQAIACGSPDEVDRKEGRGPSGVVKHSPLLRPSYVTGDLAFPSDKARANDGCVCIHNYTTLLLSGFLAAQHNNSSSTSSEAHTWALCRRSFGTHFHDADPIFQHTKQQHRDAALDMGCMNATPSDHRWHTHHCTESHSLLYGRLIIM